MNASTIEQLITTHSDMIARLDNRQSLGNISTSDFTQAIGALSDHLGAGSAADLQTAAEELGATHTFLTAAQELPDTDPAKARLIGLADQRLHNVNDLALA